MLVLSRHAGQEITVDGPCRISVIRLSANTVRLGITADMNTKILRGELEQTNTESPPSEDQQSQEECA